MISNFEVGAILRVVDEASPALLRISGSFERFSAIIKQFNDQLLTIGASAGKGAVGRDNAFGDIDKAILATQERVAALAAEAVGRRRRLAAAAVAFGKRLAASPYLMPSRMC